MVVGLVVIQACIQWNEVLIILEKLTWLEKKYIEFYEKNGYIPEMFEPYNCREITDYAPTLTANSNTSPTHAGTILIIDD